MNIVIFSWLAIILSLVILAACLNILYSKCAKIVDPAALPLHLRTTPGSSSIDIIPDWYIIAGQTDLPADRTPDGFDSIVQVNSPTNSAHGNGSTVVQNELPIHNSADGHVTAVQTDLSTNCAQKEVISVKTTSSETTALDSCCISMCL